MSQPPRFHQLLGTALLAGAVAVAAPVVAQPVRDTATAACLSAVKARSGGVARVSRLRFSQGGFGVVSASVQPSTIAVTLSPKRLRISCRVASPP